MPWQEESTMQLRRQFVQDVQSGATPMTELCAAYGISRKTGYTWLARFDADGAAELMDRSRRPHTSPHATPAELVRALLENAGRVAHEPIVIGLRPGASVAEIVRRDRADSTWRHLREPPSGILTADSGVRTPRHILVDLVPGRRYLLLGNLQDSDSTPPHLHLGMMRVVTAH